MDDTPTPRSAVIDLIVCAFSHSAARDLVGTDALRSVLEVQYRDMISDGVLHLESLWQLLTEQPDFDPAAAEPAMCAIKGWERHLVGLTICLPVSMLSYEEHEVLALAEKAFVPAETIKNILDPTARAAEEERKAKEREEQAAEQSRQVKRQSREFPVKLVVASLVAVATLAFSGVVLSQFVCSSPQYKSVSTEFAGKLPIKDAKRLGAQVGATLTDDKWIDAPRETQQEQLSTALGALAPEVTTFYIVDQSGAVVASVQRAAGGFRYRLPQ